jgi:hypothetical protein
MVLLLRYDLVTIDDKKIIGLCINLRNEKIEIEYLFNVKVLGKLSLHYGYVSH